MFAAELFDIPTVYLMTGFSSAVAAGILLWLRKDHRDSGPALHYFAAAVLAMGSGFTTFAYRETIPAMLGPPVGYALYGLATIMLWLGSAQMLGRPVRAKPAWAAFAVYVPCMLLLNSATAQHAQLRIALGSGFIVFFLALAAREAHRSPWRDLLRSVRLMRALTLAILVVTACRMLMFAFEGIPMHPDGSAPPGAARLMFALIFGAFPFAMTVAVLSVANSQLSTRLRQQAATDDLTGLVSRRSLHDRAQAMLASTPRGTAACIALLMIDLDDFKTINDRYGHVFGDRVLCHVAGVLRASLRPDSLIARYGGDEFCALVPVQSEAAAFAIAERLRSTMQDSPCTADGAPIAVTLSIGVTLHRSGANLRQLLEEADRRTYRAKSQGRNRVVVDDTAASGGESRGASEGRQRIGDPGTRGTT
ncbi:MAG: GGDEF domain-containing protein [Limnobacter sp.]|nr:GGDEF domain-containing protein [Limnobacter sp.]